MQPPAEALRLARSLGLEIEAHRTRSVDRELLGQVDLILVMEAGQKEALRVEFPFTRPKLHLLSEAVEGIEYDIPDPAGAGGEARSHLLEMVELIRSGADRIMHLAQLRSRSGPAPGSGG
jgi:protein-tyrosine-phosphatase